jgi:putative phosphoesterase
MKIGIISDIHGDLSALVTALDRLDRVHQVDRILCAGDLVGRGPKEEAVVQTIRERAIPTVLGNHDEWAYGMQPEQRAFLRGLPVDWQADVSGIRLFMTHGKPGNNMWGMYPERVSPNVVDLMLDSLKADILITGHTHIPMCIRGDMRMIINPGSLYTFASRRPSSHTYGVLSVPDRQFWLYDLLGPVDKPLPL